MKPPCKGAQRAPGQCRPPSHRVAPGLPSARPYAPSLPLSLPGPSLCFRPPLPVPVLLPYPVLDLSPALFPYHPHLDGLDDRLPCAHLAQLSISFLAACRPLPTAVPK